MSGSLTHTGNLFSLVIYQNKIFSSSSYKMRQVSRSRLTIRLFWHEAQDRFDFFFSWEKKKLLVHGSLDQGPLCIIPCQKLINEPSKELVMILSLAAFHCGASVDPFTSSFFSLRFPSLLLPSNQTPWYLTIIRSTWNAPIDSSFQTERQSFISIGWRIYLYQTRWHKKWTESSK